MEYDPHDMPLVQQLIRRDPKSMEQLIDRYGDRMRQLIGRLTAWSSDVDDLLQETLVRVWNHVPSYRGEGAFDKWLVSIAYRICRDHQRSTKRRWMNWVRFIDENRHRATESAGRSPNSSESAPSDAWNRIQSAMKELRPQDREMLVMIHIEQWSHEELAAHMGISSETLHVKLHRARTRLKKRVQCP
jgi:RNA polymerase sigma-70 factor (ECF subfamily)